MVRGNLEDLSIVVAWALIAVPCQISPDLALPSCDSLDSKWSAKTIEVCRRMGMQGSTTATSSIVSVDLQQSALLKLMPCFRRSSYTAGAISVQLF